MSFSQPVPTPSFADNKAGNGNFVVTLSGSFRRTGTVEIERGTTLSHIVYEVAGGAREGCELKAIQVGTPWGGLVPISNLDIPYDSESLAKADCCVGDGSIVALDTSECVVNFAQRASAVAHRTVCGQCTFGREGTRQFVDVLMDLTRGLGTSSDLELLRRVGEGMKVGSLCVNGATAPQVVLTALKHFRAEFEAHAEAKRCPLNVCAMVRDQK